MFQDYMTWGQKNFKWRQDLLFDQQFEVNKDDSENKIYGNIQSLIETVENEGLNFENDVSDIKTRLTIVEEPDMSVKRKKTMKIAANIYSASYFGFIKANKKELKMTESDQFALLFKALLICGVQIFFSFCIAFYGNVKFTMYNNVPL